MTHFDDEFLCIFCVEFAAARDKGIDQKVAREDKGDQKPEIDLCRYLDKAELLISLRY